MRLVAAALVALCAREVAAGGVCRIVGVDYLPAVGANPDPGLRRPLSIVAWLETPAGELVDTIFITEQVGTYGLGNRPGRMDFNSGPDWPYGRRITTFPVWAHRHGREWPLLVFQDEHDDNLSHTTAQSSVERHYFRPMTRDDPRWDAETRATTIGPYTDKGKISANKSLYPPREDVVRRPEDDAVSVAMYDELNPFDAVSQASPRDGEPSSFAWSIPPELPAGPYVLFVEVNREFDHNATYTVDARPSPAVSYGEYGMPYRGQPSVVYRVPFTLGAEKTTATTDAYVGYGDPDGLDGNLRAPDSTITVDVPGSGAQRLALVPGGNYRVRVTAGPDDDVTAPAAIDEIVSAATTNRIVLSFTAPGDDVRQGTVKGYEIRYLVGETMTPESFARGIEVRPTYTIAPGGALQTMTLEKLLPESQYSIGIRATDNCDNASPIAIVDVMTGERKTGEVDACFIATAAYGSVLANDVEMLRRFRDLAMSRSVLGQLAVTTYYTFSPPAAALVGESDLLRHTARDMLAPVVARVRRWTY